MRAGRGQAACPICGSATQDACRPFCSPRCADVDLGRWLKEVYVVPEPDEAETSEDDTSRLLSRGSGSGEET